MIRADYLWKDILRTGLVKTPELIKRLLLLLADQAASGVSVNGRRGANLATGPDHGAQPSRNIRSSTSESPCSRLSSARAWRKAL